MSKHLFSTFSLKWKKNLFCRKNYIRSISDQKPCLTLDFEQKMMDFVVDTQKKTKFNVTELQFRMQQNGNLRVEHKENKKAREERSAC